jgi:ribosome-binding ATPase YchF (GTP1/OBG family)
VEGRIDPVADIETVETELMLADLDSLERRRDALEKKAKGGDKEAKLTLDLIFSPLGFPRPDHRGGFIEVETAG